MDEKVRPPFTPIAVNDIIFLVGINSAGNTGSTNDVVDLNRETIVLLSNFMEYDFTWPDSTGSHFSKEFDGSKLKPVGTASAMAAVRI
jgi:hypothetical protein